MFAVAIGGDAHRMTGHVWCANQRISAEEAIFVGTMNGAYASYEENLKGSIEPGKLADLVVLGRDPFKEDPSTLVTIPVERTMARGKWVLRILIAVPACGNNQPGKDESRTRMQQKIMQRDFSCAETGRHA